MQSSGLDPHAAARDRTRAAALDNSAPDSYLDAERQFAALLEQEGLDARIREQPATAHLFAPVLDSACELAYTGGSASGAAHLFLQRVLYRVNRLKLFWYDELRRYANERSNYVRAVRDRIEDAWQDWELTQFGVASPHDEEVGEALRRRAAEDVAPAASPDGLYFRERMSEAGYRRLLAIASLDGLVEASQMSRTLGGVSNEIQATMTRLLVEEYGGGRLGRKHSSFFTVMLSELGMSVEPEAYFGVVPWEVLAAVNHSFLLSERKRFYLRYVGGLLYTEVSVPAAFDHYRAAAERLGMSEAARGYWELHIREDERHGRWMLNDVALPLAARYPREAWEIVLGYDQQKFLSGRAGAAVAREARAAEREATANTKSAAARGGA